MGAESAAEWVCYTVPFLALGVIWKAYSSLLPKLFWILVLAFSYFLFSVVGFAASAFVIFLINVFVAYFKIEKDEKSKKEEMLRKAFDAQRGNYR